MALEELDRNAARDDVLRGIEKGLHVAHHRVEVLRLVEQHAVEVGEVILLIPLPLGEDDLLQLPMRLNEDERRRGLERHPAFDAEDRVAHVDVAPHPVLRADFIERFDEGDAVHWFAIERDGQALLEVDRQLEGFIGRLGGHNRVGIRRVGQRLVGRVRLLPADGGAPQAAVDRVARRVGRHVETALGQKGRRVFPAEAQSADGREHVEVLAQNLQRHVEPDLVVAGAGGAVRHGLRPHLLGHVHDAAGLHHPLGPHAQRIDVAAQHVALDQIAQVIGVQLVAPVDHHVVGGAQRQRAILDGIGLVHVDAAGVHGDGDDGRVVGLAEVGDAEGGVKPSAES